MWDTGPSRYLKAHQINTDKYSVGICDYTTFWLLGAIMLEQSDLQW